MSDQFQKIIIIPCYNEARNFDFKEYSNFITSNPNILVCFVNDGSTDTTLEILNTQKENSPLNVDVISHKFNLGKAETVRTGMLYCYTKYTYNCIAYLDADLSVSLYECAGLSQNFSKDIDFCFGSRIAKVGSTIQRKKSRFLIGRIIATLISNTLSLIVYDTQCGCKLFKKELAQQVFREPFISKWLFDVEIFFRIIELYGKEKCLNQMVEIPLVKWTDRGDSKVKYSYCFKLFHDLYLIKLKYKNVISNS